MDADFLRPADTGGQAGGDQQFELLVRQFRRPHDPHGMIRTGCAKGFVGQVC